MSRYKLDETGNPVVANDLMDWANAMATREFSLCDTTEDYVVSTVFIGIATSEQPHMDHLWETAVFFKDPTLGSRTRKGCRTFDEACRMHAEMKRGANKMINE